MTKYISLLLLFVIMLVPFQNSIEELTENERVCFGVGMVGYDSVINAKIGVPPEDTLHLVKDYPNLPIDHPLNKIPMLTTILSAYLWKGTPHSYSIDILNKCLIQMKTLT